MVNTAQDFYDHPKVAGLTLEAIGLWTKAGQGAP